MNIFSIMILDALFTITIIYSLIIDYYYAIMLYATLNDYFINLSPPIESTIFEFSLNLSIIILFDLIP
jgi:hypothetical protein